MDKPSTTKHIRSQLCSGVGGANSCECKAFGAALEAIQSTRTQLPCGAALPVQLAQRFHSTNDAEDWNISLQMAALLLQDVGLIPEPLAEQGDLLSKHVHHQSARMLACIRHVVKQHAAASLCLVHHAGCEVA